MEFLDQIFDYLGYVETLRLIFAGCVVLLIRWFIRVLFELSEEIFSFICLVFRAVGISLSYFILSTFYRQSLFTSALANQMQEAFSANENDPDFCVYVTQSRIILSGVEDHTVTYSSLGYRDLKSFKHLSACCNVLGESFDSTCSIKLIQKDASLSSEYAYQFSIRTTAGKLRNPLFHFSSIFKQIRGK